MINFIRSDLVPTTETLLSHSNGVVETSIIHIKKLKLVLINVYRLPNCNPNSFRTTISEITETLNTLPDIMLVGNFNLPIIKWPSRKISGGTSGNQEQAKQLITLTEKYFLMQVI